MRSLTRGSLRRWREPKDRHRVFAFYLTIPEANGDGDDDRVANADAVLINNARGSL